MYFPAALTRHSRGSANFAGPLFWYFRDAAGELCWLEVSFV